MIVSPAQEWPVVAAEQTTPAQLYPSYIVPLALISPVCTFIGTAFFAHRSLLLAAVVAALTFVLELVYVAIEAVIVNVLAPSFSAVQNQNEAFKLVAYAYTPRWVAGIGNLIPVLGAIIVLVGSLYSLYLLYLGVPPVMRAPQEKALGYTIVIVLVGILLAVAISVVIGIVFAIMLGVTGAVAGSMLSR